MKEEFLKETKELSNVAIRLVSIDWIKKNVNFIEENRSHYLDDETSTAHNFTLYDKSRLVSRIKFYNNQIFKKKPLWKECCPMIVYYVDGKFYLVDGQGRFLAIDIYNRNAEDKITEIPVQVIFNKTYNEMVEDMMALNRFNKNWSTSDLFRCQCLMTGDDSLCENMTRIKNELGVKEYPAKLILFGYTKSSHREAITSKEYSPYKDVMFKYFKKFYDGTTEACAGNKSQISTLKKIDIAQSLYKIFSNVIRNCEENNIPYEKKLDKTVTLLTRFTNRLNRLYEFNQVFGGKQKSIASTLAKAVSKHTEDKYIVEAMNKVLIP